MAEETKKVVFADKEREDAFRRLAISQHPEDEKTYRVLQRIRSKLLEQHLFGTEIPREKIPPVYVRMFAISNLWRLETPPHGTVLYTRVGEELRIVDIL